MDHLELTKSEEQLIRRLGMAVRARWNAIPPFAQDQILDQASEAEIWPASTDVREALTSFLEKPAPDEPPLE